MTPHCDCDSVNEWVPNWCWSEHRTPAAVKEEGAEVVIEVTETRERTKARPKSRISTAISGTSVEINVSVFVCVKANRAPSKN